MLSSGHRERKDGFIMEKQEKNTASPYELDGRPPLKVAIPLGLQHVLAMFVGNLTPLLIITAACGIEAGGDLQVALLQNAMLIAGIVQMPVRWLPQNRVSTNGTHSTRLSLLL